MMRMSARNVEKARNYPVSVLQGAAPRFLSAGARGNGSEAWLHEHHTTGFSRPSRQTIAPQLELAGSMPCRDGNAALPLW
jgi:hypothetical protein